MTRSTFCNSKIISPSEKVHLLPGSFTEEKRKTSNRNGWKCACQKIRNVANEYFCTEYREVVIVHVLHSCPTKIPLYSCQKKIYQLCCGARLLKALWSQRRFQFVSKYNLSLEVAFQRCANSYCTTVISPASCIWNLKSDWQCN